MELKDFGVNLARARMKADLSAYELSLRIDKDPSYIHKVENGKINISLKSILQICEVLQIQPAELFKPLWVCIKTRPTSHKTPGLFFASDQNVQCYIEIVGKFHQRQNMRICAVFPVNEMRGLNASILIDSVSRNSSVLKQFS